MPGFEEAKWTLEMAKNPQSIISGTCVEIPVKLGAQKVEEFLNELREADGTLPKGLKGTRQIYSANNPDDAMKNPTFEEGLAKMNELGPNLTFEFCPHPREIPTGIEVFAKFPTVQVVLNHMGFYNGGKQTFNGPKFDLDTHMANLTKLSALPNVVVKIGAIELFFIDDPTPLTRHCL